MESITFHAAQIDDAAIDQVQAIVRKRLLHAFVARGHLEPQDAKDMGGYLQTRNWLQICLMGQWQEDLLVVLPKQLARQRNRAGL